MLRTKLLPTFNAIPASGSAGTATVDLPVGLMYHAVWLRVGYDATNGTNPNEKYTGNSAANQIIGDIRVKINGKTQRIFSAKQLNALNSAYDSACALITTGTAGSSGYREFIPIYFAEPWRKDVREQELSAWNVVGVRSFQIEVDLKALTSPVLGGFYEFEPGDTSRDIGTIVKHFRQTFAAAGTAIDINTLDRRDRLQAIHLFATSDGKYVDNVKLTANGVELRDVAMDYLDNYASLKARGMNPNITANSTTNYLGPQFDVVMDYNDALAANLLLNGLDELTLRTEFSAAASGTIDALIERAGPPE